MHRCPRRRCESRRDVPSSLRALADPPPFRRFARRLSNQYTTSTSQKMHAGPCAGLPCARWASTDQTGGAWDRVPALARGMLEPHMGRLTISIWYDSSHVHGGSRVAFKVLGSFGVVRAPSCSRASVLGRGRGGHAAWTHFWPRLAQTDESAASSRLWHDGMNSLDMSCSLPPTPMMPSTSSAILISSSVRR